VGLDGQVLDSAKSSSQVEHFGHSICSGAVRVPGMPDVEPLVCARTRKRPKVAVALHVILSRPVDDVVPVEVEQCTGAELPDRLRPSTPALSENRTSAAVFVPEFPWMNLMALEDAPGAWRSDPREPAAT